MPTGIGRTSVIPGCYSYGSTDNRITIMSSPLPCHSTTDSIGRLCKKRRCQENHHRQRRNNHHKPFHTSFPSNHDTIPAYRMTICHFHVNGSSTLHDLLFQTACLHPCNYN